MKKYTSSKILLLICFFLVKSYTSNAQFFTKHYIAPSSWQYFSNANEIVIATNSITTVNIALNKSDGTLVTNLTAIKGSPAVYRFAGSPTALPVHAFNTVLNAAGLIVTSDGPTSINLRNVASDQIAGGDPYIKGNASLTSFGDAGLGVNFRVGYYRNGTISGSETPTYSIMAVNNSTTIKLSGVAITTLNAGQSYLFKAAIGSLVETSSPVVMNTCGRVDSPSGCGDGTFDQIPPVSVLGSEYYIVRGQGNNTAEQTTVVATQANTVVTIDKYSNTGTFLSTSNVTLTNAGDFTTFINGDSSNAFSATRIVTTRNVAVYSGTAISCEVDISSIAPVSSCSGSVFVETSQFKAYNNSILPYFGYVLLKDATAIVDINGINIESIAGVRRQLGSTGWYLIDFTNTQISSPAVISISSTVKLTISMVQQGGGFSMAGFFSNFIEQPTDPVLTYASGLQCSNESALLVATPGFSPYQWYLNGVVLAGQTSNTITVTKTGSYTVSSTLSCGDSVQSKPIPVTICSDVSVTNTVNNPTPCIGSNVVFTITAANAGPSNADGVSVTDILPTGYTYVSSVVPAGTSYNNTNGIWAVSNLDNATNAILTITATVKATGSYSNTATINSSSQPDANTSNNTAVISTTPNPLPVGVVVTTSICSGASNTIPLTSSIVGTTFTYATPIVTGGVTGGNARSTGSTADITDVLVNPTGTAQTATYTVTPTAPSGCVGSPFTVTITVNPTPIGVAALKTICSEQTVNQALTTSPVVAGTTFTYPTPIVTGGITGGNARNTGSTADITDVLVNPTGTAQTATYTITPTAPTGCVGSTFTVTITVNPTPIGVSVTKTFCSGQTVDQALTTSPVFAGTTFTYPIPIVTGGITGGNARSTGSTADITDVLVNPTGTAQTAIYTVTPTAPSGCAGSPFTVTITVNPTPIGVAALKTICSGQTVNQALTTSPVVAGTTFTYPTPIVTGGITGGNARSTGSTADITDVLVNPTGTAQTATYTVTPTAPSGCIGSAFTITITVNPTPIGVSVTKTVCSGRQTVNQTLTTNPFVTGTTFTYPTPVVTGGITGGNTRTTGSTADIKDILINPTSSIQTATYTITPTSPTGCVGSTFTVVVTVSPVPVLTASQVQNICANISGNATANLSLTTNPSSSGASFTWTPPVLSGGMTYTDHGFATGTIIDDYNNPTTQPQTATYSVTPITSGSLGGCIGDVATVVITVNPNPIVTSGLVQTICSGQITNRSLSSTTTGVVYSYSAPTISGAPGNITGGTSRLVPSNLAITDLLINTTGIVQTATYMVTALINGCPGNPVAVVITVNPTPSGVAAIKSICNSQYVNQGLTTNPLVSGTTFTYASPVVTGGITGGTARNTGSSADITDVLINSTGTAQTATYTITPTAPSGCVGSTFTVTITVNPTPIGVAVLKTICSEQSVNQALTTNPLVSGTTFTYASPVVTGGITGGTARNTGSSADITDILINPTGISQTATYTITPTGPTGCLGTTFTVIITLNPTPSGVDALKTICSGQTVNQTLTTSPVVSGTTFTYSTPVVTGGITGGTARNTGNTADITDVLVNPTGVLQTAIYTVTPTASTGCVGGTFTVTITVSPTPATPTATTTVQPTCTVSTGTITITAPVSAGMTYSIDGSTYANTTGIFNLVTIGTYTVTAKSIDGCISSGTSVIVDPQPATPSIPSLGVPTQGTCMYTLGSVVLSGLPSGNWTINQNGTYTANYSSSGSSYLITALAPGSYNFTVTNSVGCTSGATVNTSLNNIICAVADTNATAVNGYTGGTAIANVLTNDKLNGVAVIPSEVTLTLATALPTGITFNTSTGEVAVNAGTPAGTYTFDYIVCEVLNPANCSSTTVTVNVAQAPILAVADTNATAVNGYTGGTAIANVLSNDKLNGVAVIPSEVALTLASALPTEITFNTSTGEVAVNAGTPAGTYTFDYSICEVLNPANCSSTTVTVNVAQAPILAVADTNATAVNGYTGGTAIANVLSNDKLNGVAVIPSEVALTLASALPTGITFNTSTGEVAVNAGTPAGTYTFDYSICEVLNPANCSTTTVTVNVAQAPILAVADTNATAVNGYTGGTAIANVLTNDKLNGVAVIPSEVALTLATALPTGITFNTSTGEVAVNAGTPAGTYTFDYSICEVLNPANCSSTTVTVNVAQAPILAVADTNATAVNGYTGGTAIANVLTNDKLNGVAVIPSEVALTLATALPTGVTFNTSTGEVAVNAGTPAGTYTFDYSICEVLNPANCSTTTVTVNVGQAPILAVTDTNTTAVNGYTGGTAIANVLTNDKLNGVAVIPSEVALTLATALPTGITFNTSTGEVAVNAGTPAGTYTFDYSICEVLNPANCSTTTVTINVVQAPILAVADTNATAVNGYTGGTAIANVLTNDKLNGVAIIPAEVALTLATALPTGITFNTSTGEVAVNAGTPAGTFTFDYSICEVLNPANCSTTTITVNVGQAPILAVADTNATAVNGYTGGTAIANVLTNDKLNGVAVIPSEVALTLASALPTGITFNTSTGEVAVNAGTPAGTYTFDYSICEVLNPANCSSTTVTVNVGQAPILAVTDTNTTAVNGYTGGTAIANVLTNDKLNGVAVIPSEVALTLATALPTGITFNTSTGEVAVNAGTPAGTYTFDYSICEVLNPANCSTTTVTINVAQAPILAVADTNATAVNGYTGGTAIANVLTNDKLNGVAVIPAEVALTLASALPTGITFNTSTGEVAVNAGTPAGTYTFDYSICEVLNPANCSTTTVTVNVAQAPILAVADTNATAVNGYTGGTAIANVLSNDKLNGVAVIPSEVALTLATALPTGITFNTSTGEVAVNAGTPAGTYTFDYSVCEVLNPANCSTTTVTINVAQAPILAVADTNATAVNGYTGGTAIANVLTNDKLNGVAVIPAEVALTLATALPTGITFNTSTGEVAVNAGTPAGTYTFDYSICEVLNPANCSSTTVTVNVAQAPILAIADTNATAVNGYTGGTAIANVLSNDKLNGVAVIPSEVALTLATALPTGITFNTSTGEVAVNAGTPAGTYTFDYSICEVLNPANCSTITITVNVGQAPILAVADTNATAVNGYTGGTAIANVLTNDKLNGVAVIPSEVALTLASALPTGITFNTSTGEVAVNAGTPAGTYTFDYSICEVLNPANCSSTTVTINVAQAAIDAVDDSVASIVGINQMVTVLNVLANDQLNGASINSTQVMLSQTVADSSGFMTLNSDGTIVLAPNTPAGTYTLTYQICEILNPSNCNTAIVTVSVVAPTMTITTSNLCLNDTPYVSYTVTPDNFTATNLLTVKWIDSANTVVATQTNLPLTGQLLWPGTVLDGSGKTIDWPGWLLVNGKWIQGSDGFELTRPTVTMEFSLNPTLSVIVNYPPATALCNSAPTFVIDAVNDSASTPVNSQGAALGVINVFGNDTLNTLGIKASDVIVTVLISNPNLALNPDGTIDVLPNTPAGTYTLTYQICEKGNSSNCDTATVTVLVQIPAMTLIKTATLAGSVLAGETITYTFTITNTGNIAINNIVINDALLSATPIAVTNSLAIGSVTNIKVNYIITQADIDLGKVVNSAIASGVDTNGTALSVVSDNGNPIKGGDRTTVLQLIQKPSIALIKTVVFEDDNNDGFAQVGETVTYHFVITNTGNIPLNDVKIEDLLPGITIIGAPITLSVGQVDDTTFTATYKLKQSDINLGSITNQASVEGKSLNGTIVKDMSDDLNNASDNPTVLGLSGCIIEIFNAVSPNGDGNNDLFYIRGLECYPDNTVAIFNRWGVLVFERNGYNNTDRAFKGISEGRVTITQAEELPVGTYYYVLKYKTGINNSVKKSGYLYINRK